MVRHDLPRAGEPEAGEPGEHAALVRDLGRQDDVEGRDAIAGDEQEALVVERVELADLSAPDVRGGFRHTLAPLLSFGRARGGARRRCRRDGCTAPARTSRRGRSGRRSRRPPRTSSRKSCSSSQARIDARCTSRYASSRASPLSTSASRSALAEEQAVALLEVPPHPLGEDDEPFRRATRSGRACSRARGTRPAGPRARPRSARCRARARGRRSRARRARRRGRRARGRRSAPATTGFRLCGIADEPFWPLPNGSSTSRTSVRARCRISSAKRVERGGRHRERREQLGVAVALEDLRRGRRRLEAQPLARDPLDLRVGRRVRADGPGELPDAKSLERALDADAVAVELERPARQLQAERRRLGVDAVRTPDRERVAVLLGARDDRIERACRAPRGSDGRPPGSGATSAVSSDVRRGQPVVEPAALLAELLRDGVDERGHVVVRALLDLAHAFGRRRLRTGAGRLGGVVREPADLRPARRARRARPRATRASLRSLRPDSGHRRTGVAGDHQARLAPRQAGLTRPRGCAPRARRRSSRCRRRPPPPARPAASGRSRAARRDRRARSGDERSGTPITGRSVCAATTPGSAAASPAPQMSTRMPRSRAVRAYSATALRVPVRRPHVELVRDPALVELVERRPASARGRTPSRRGCRRPARQPTAPRRRFDRDVGPVAQRRRTRSARPRRTPASRASPIVAADRRHVEDPAAVRHEPAVAQRRPGVEDERARRLGVLDALDRGAAVASGRVVARRQHDGDRGVVGGRDGRRPARSPAAAAASASSRSPSSARQDRLRLRVAEAAVELEHARAVVGQHQARRRGVRRTASRAARARRAPAGGRRRRARRLGVEQRDGRVGAHAAGVRALVAVVRRA